ncbi:MAG: hypothetical protein J1E64_12210 [Acetatifactor sp.]|nr:hypothetical protein [Acetatifactor sp.]
MTKKVQNSFSGMLDLQGIGNGQCDAFFNMQDNIVTIIPLTNECRKYAHILSYNDGTNEKDNWLYGFSEDGCSIAFLQKTHLHSTLSSPVDMGTSRFSTPIIIKSSRPDNKDLSTFDAIEFRGGIVDLLYNPDLAVRNDYKNNCIVFNDKSDYTYSFAAEVAGERFQITYSIDVSEVCLEVGKVPDLRNAIHSIVRFDLEDKKPLKDIEKYYSYAMNLFQFCSGQLNVGFEIRLYQKEFYNGERIANPSPILVNFIDGFEDYANDKLDITKVIRFRYLGEKISVLFKNLSETESGGVDNSSNEIHNLCKELMEKIDETEYDSDLKKRAKGIVGQLKHPTIKMIIFCFYSSYEKGLRQITERIEHIKLGISKSYSPDAFKQKISHFVDIRNKVAHVGILWNDGIEIYLHLKILIYFSILNRSNYSLEESTSIISYLFGRFF